jgi:hypothetical protein
MAAMQPSLLKTLKARLVNSIKQYNQALDILNTLPDDADDDAYGKAKDRERLLRGVVRGSAQMYIVVANPAQQSDKNAINDLEIDYGMPGKRSRPRAKASDIGSKFLEEYYGE